VSRRKKASPEAPLPAKGNSFPSSHFFKQMQSLAKELVKKQQHGGKTTGFRGKKKKGNGLGKKTTGKKTKGDVADAPPVPKISGKPLLTEGESSAT